MSILAVLISSTDTSSDMLAALSPHPKNTHEGHSDASCSWLPRCLSRAVTVRLRRPGDSSVCWICLGARPHLQTRADSLAWRAGPREVRPGAASASGGLKVDRLRIPGDPLDISW